MRKVESSFIDAIGFAVRGGETLLAVIIRGDTYTFHGVPRETYDRMLEAESKGKFFNDEILAFYGNHVVESGTYVHQHNSS